MVESDVALKVRVTDPSDTQHDLTATPGALLMEVLREAGLVEATCGGMCSCGTCVVQIQGTPADLPPPDEAELDLLEAFCEDLPSSASPLRLSCQIQMEPELDGLDVSIIQEL